MVRISVEHRAEIDIVRAESLYIVELFGNAPQIAAEEHVVLHVGSRIFAVLRNSAVPIRIEDCAVLHAAFSAASESVDEYVVYYGALQLFRNMKRTAIYEKLTIRVFGEDFFTLSAERTLFSSRGNPVAVKPKSRRKALRGDQNAPDVSPEDKAFPFERKALLFSAVAPYQKLGIRHSERTVKGEGKPDILPFLRRPRNEFAVGTRAFFFPENILHYFTGERFHIFSAYSRMLRSDEKYPAPAILQSDFFAHFMLSA